MRQNTRLAWYAWKNCRNYKSGSGSVRTGGPNTPAAGGSPAPPAPTTNREEGTMVKQAGIFRVLAGSVGKGRLARLRFYYQPLTFMGWDESDPISKEEERRWVESEAKRRGCNTSELRFTLDARAFADKRPGRILDWGFRSPTFEEVFHDAP